jgi:hypothetical protein
LEGDNDEPESDVEEFIDDIEEEEFIAASSPVVPGNSEVMERFMGFMRAAQDRMAKETDAATSQKRKKHYSGNSHRTTQHYMHIRKRLKTEGYGFMTDHFKPRPKPLEVSS